MFRLQKLADRLVDLFVSSRLMTRQYDRVKLHMTVINSLMRRAADNMDAEVSAQRGAGQGPRGGTGRERESFRASRLLKVCAVQESSFCNRFSDV